MHRKILTLITAQDFHNAAMQSPYMSSKYISCMNTYNRLMALTTPPATLKAIVDEIQTARNVTLYRKG